MAFLLSSSRGCRAWATSIRTRINSWPCVSMALRPNTSPASRLTACKISPSTNWSACAYKASTNDRCPQRMQRGWFWLLSSGHDGPRQRGNKSIHLMGILPLVESTIWAPCRLESVQNMNSSSAISEKNIFPPAAKAPAWAQHSPGSTDAFLLGELPILGPAVHRSITFLSATISYCTFIGFGGGNWLYGVNLS